jgi:hypothetical protein
LTNLYYKYGIKHEGVNFTFFIRENKHGIIIVDDILYL